MAAHIDFSDRVNVKILTAAEEPPPVNKITEHVYRLICSVAVATKCNVIVLGVWLCFREADHSESEKTDKRTCTSWTQRIMCNETSHTTNKKLINHNILISLSLIDGHKHFLIFH